MLVDSIGRALFRVVHGRYLVYASCWEDPRVDIEAMRLDSSSRVLVITSAGCNALDYAIEAPESVTAVDVNYRQTALLELKLAGITELPWTDFFELFGAGHHPNAAGIYRDSLREHLSVPAQKYWDQHIGVFSGRLPFYFRTTSGWFALWFRRYIDRILRLGPDIDELINAGSIDSQREIYDARIRDRFWQPLLGFILRRDATLALSAIPPVQRRRILREHPDILSYLRSRAEHVLYNQPLSENYFWRVYLTGQFTTECCPRYLKREHFQSLKLGLSKRVQPVTDTVAGFLERTEHDYSHFVLLDHMDWMAERDQAGLRDEWQGIVNHATHKAKVLWRSFGVGSDFIDSTQVRIQNGHEYVGALLQYDRAKASDLQKRERVNAYASLHIATIDDGHRRRWSVA